MSLILGISAFYHDSAAALLNNGKIVGAVQEERFTRIKHDSNFPVNAIKSLLKDSNISFSQVNHVIFYDKPFLKFDRLLETYIANAPKGFTSFAQAMPVWLREKLFLKDLIYKELKKLDSAFKIDNIFFSEHHFSHAASAFYPSPFDKSLILVMDGVGEWATSTVALGKNNKIEILKEIKFPHSLGLLYSAFTYYIGFKVNSGEYKLMGLAPYGTPKYKEIIINKLIDLKKDGSFRVHQDYFDYSTGLKMVNKKFTDLFNHPVRRPDKDKLTQFHMDIAASIQSVTEDILLLIARDLNKEYKIDNLCMAGGVALNCVANGKLIKDGSFKNIWIQPAAGDAGGALGAALSLWHQEFDNERSVEMKDSMQGSFLGPEFDDNQIETQLISCGANFNKMNEEDMIEFTSSQLAENKAVGWFQGKMEFGPRALGSRSIIASPISENTQKNLNLKVKFRESFRPFAPSILEEHVNDWFNLDIESPYMLLTAPVQEDKRTSIDKDESDLFGVDRLNIKRSQIPAVTHVDYSARVQTVSEKTNRVYYKLIKSFYSKTNVPILVNTSFNVRGEPIVYSPLDAYKCFMGTNLDLLVIGNFIMIKENQNCDLKEDYKNKYELD